MNILVIGGSGFIGTALIKELLTLGYYVRNFDKNPSLDFSGLSTIADVRDRDALKGGIVDKEERVKPSKFNYNPQIQSHRLLMSNRKSLRRKNQR